MKVTKSYLKITEAALKRYLKEGIKKVSVEEICADAGLSKMTFYRTFSSKEELTLIVLEKYLAQNLEVYRALMHEDISYVEKFKKIIEIKKAATDEISEAFYKDIFSDASSKYQVLMQNHWVSIQEEIKNDFEKGQKQGAISKELKVDFILLMMDKINAIFEDPQLIDLYKGNRKEAASALSSFFFNGILTHNDE